MGTIDIIAAVVATIVTLAIVLLVAVVRVYMGCVMNDKENEK